MKASITATARYLPKKVLTNTDLEKMVETNDEWIVSRTGIRERRIVDHGEVTSHMGTKVAQQLLQKSGTSPTEIDLIIVATVTPDMVFPSTACLIQSRINATNSWAFDLNAACSGFLFGFQTGASFIESGRYKKVMLIGADTMSSIVNYEDRTTCVLFGDGAGGVLLEPSSDETGLIDSLLYCDGTGANALKMDAGGSLHPASIDTVTKKMHFIKQEGQKVFKFAVKGMADVTEEIVKRNKLPVEKIKLFIPHQANKRIIDACAERLGLRDDQIFINIDQYANTTAATIPIALSEVVDQKILEKYDNVILSAFGAGFSWGSILIRWGDAV